MRVLLFRSLCDTGGISTSMLLLGRQLLQRGIECEYWFCKASHRLPEFMETGRATLGPLSQLAARLERGEFDVVQMTASDEMAPLVARMANNRARIIITARGSLAEGWNHTNCFAYTAISEGMAEVNQPYTDVRIEVVRNAIDADRYEPPAALTGDRPIVAFVGRTTSPEKDFARFTRIARRLHDGGARVWVADPHGASWEKFANERAEKFDIERWAPVLNADIPAFYREVAASNGVVLITSLSEGFGNVAPEAAACGARVAAPNVIGLREAVIDGVTGRLYAPAATDDTVAAMLQSWMQEPHDMLACSRNSKEAFSATALADAYVQLYTRKEQLRVSGPVPDAAFAERASLLELLQQQKTWRARAARASALDFASNGYADFAISALVSAWRLAPGQFMSRAGSLQLLRTLRSLAGRSAVRRLASRIGSL